METAVTASAAAPGTAALLIVALSRWLSDPAVLQAASPASLQKHLSPSSCSTS
jgi:hypothetical protein